MIGEYNESFQIVIMEDALQINVEAGYPATISMTDNNGNVKGGYPASLSMNDNSSKCSKCVAI